jgi:hypothetical protein
MPKWSKGARAFVVTLDCYKNRGCKAQVPRPIMEMLGQPKKLRYVVKGNKVEIEAV